MNCLICNSEDIEFYVDGVKCLHCGVFLSKDVLIEHGKKITNEGNKENLKLKK